MKVPRTIKARLIRPAFLNNIRSMRIVIISPVIGILTNVNCYWDPSKLTHLNRYFDEDSITNLYPPLRSTFAVRETASLGIMGAPAVPPLNPSETIVLWDIYWLRIYSRIRRAAVRGAGVSRHQGTDWGTSWIPSETIVFWEHYRLWGV